MALDVDAPDPPPLDTDRPNAGAGEHHRADLQAFLESGAWERGFAEWAEHTDLSETEWTVVVDLDLLEAFDFFWDDVADRVGYSAPGLPEDWRERDLHPNLESWGQVSTVNAGLGELGRVVADLLTVEYVDWDADYEEPDDLPEF